MEKSKLEQLIKKLENLDVREWDFNADADALTTEVGGMEFRISKYALYIRNTENKMYFEEAFTSKETKKLEKSLKNLYNKTRTALIEYQTRKIEEKLNNFLSE